MKRLLWICLIAASTGAAAAEERCPAPEYAFTKGASKSAVRDEYCVLTRKAQRYEKFHKLTQEAIQKKYALHLSADKESEESIDELQAANSCKAAAAVLADTLTRRFKSKPPASCD
jgi:hypothetical protein